MDEMECTYPVGDCVIKKKWFKINPEIDDIPTDRFLLSDEFGNVYEGFTAFDYYEAVYWFPMPKYPKDE